MTRIVGWYGKQNVGDEAFRDAFQEGLRLAGNESSLEFFEVAPGDKKGFILGGGDVIRPFYLDPIESSRPFYPIGVGLGYESEVDLLKNKNIPFAVVRSERDAEIFKSANISTEYCPDITFVLQPPVAESLNRSDSKKNLCLLLSDEVNPTFESKDASNYMYYEYFKWELASILDTLAEYYIIHMVPFSTLDSIDDRKMNLDIYRRMQRRDHVRLRHDTLSVQGARNLISSFELCITMKYHGMLFAVQGGVPFINIAETRKTQLFCHENGFSDLSIPKFSLERERFMNTVRMAESEKIKILVGEQSHYLRNLARARLPAALQRASETSDS